MSRRTAAPDRQLPRVHRVEWCWPATRRPFAHRARRLQTKFAVGSEPHELKSVVVGFSVDQYGSSTFQMEMGRLRGAMKPPML